MPYRDISIALCAISSRGAQPLLPMTAEAFVASDLAYGTSFALHLRMRAFTRLAMAALMMGAGCGGEPVEIRFENATEQTFDLLQVAFGRDAEFRGLRPGEVTEYQEFDGAYSYGFVRAVIGTAEYVIQPVDYVGEKELDSGKYTHLLRIVGPAPDGLSGVTSTDD